MPRPEKIDLSYRDPRCVSPFQFQQVPKEANHQEGTSTRPSDKQGTSAQQQFGSKSRTRSPQKATTPLTSNQQSPSNSIDGTTLQKLTNGIMSLVPGRK
ncbi:unnamed protein product [Caenorhabditis brenneri]